MSAETTDCGMNVFISWSGDRGQHVARTLRNWIPHVLQSVKPWMSDQDLEPGSRWADELAKILESINYGIICLTPETINTPWMLFEAGALAKALSNSVVCPYLIDLEPGDLKGPLHQFNAVLADRDGTLGLFKSINKTLENRRIDAIILENTFDKWWPEIEKDLKLMPDVPGGHSILLAESGLGLEYLSEKRGPALEIFEKYMKAEIERGQDGRIWMVGTSMRGFLDHPFGGDVGRELLHKAVERKVELRLMLVNPDKAESRETFEGRPNGSIPSDIRSSIGELRSIGMDRSVVHYYDSGPTVFGIATSDRMLLNPYPSSLAAHAGFTLVVRKTNQRTDIYQQYFSAHFDKLWEDHSFEVPEDDWQPTEINRKVSRKVSRKKPRTISRKVPK